MGQATDSRQLTQHKTGRVSTLTLASDSFDVNLSNYESEPYPVMNCSHVITNSEQVCLSEKSVAQMVVALLISLDALLYMALFA